MWMWITSNRCGLGRERAGQGGRVGHAVGLLRREDAHVEPLGAGRELGRVDRAPGPGRLGQRHVGREDRRLDAEAGQADARLDHGHGWAADPDREGRNDVEDLQLGLSGAGAGAASAGRRRL